MREPSAVDVFPAGRARVDVKSVGDVGAVVLRDRQLLADDGFVAVAVTVDRAGAVVAGPEIATRGFVYVDESAELLEDLKRAALGALAEGRPGPAFDREVARARV